MNENPSKVRIRCLPVTQPIGTFYIGTIDAADLVDIAWVDIRRIDPAGEEDGARQEGAEVRLGIDTSRVDDSVIEEMDRAFLSTEEQDFEEFLGIQRELNRSRVKELRQYVGTQDAAFPTSVLIAVSSERASYDEVTSTIWIDRDSRSVKIIDGQHRIAGLEGYRGSQFDVNVSVFIDMDLQDQAMVFATINLKQTKVNKSLAYEPIRIY